MPTLSFVPTNLHTGHVGENAVYATSTFPIMHLICAPLPPAHPQILHNLSFLLGITAVPREIENNSYTNFVFSAEGEGANKMRYSTGGSGV